MGGGIKMSKLVLSKTLELQDIIPIGLCGLVHSVVNGNIFEDAPGTTFGNFINLRSKTSLKVKNRKQLYALYVIRALSETINPRSHAEEWITKILRNTGIEPKYYDSHSMDFYREKLPRKNKKFKEAIDGAIEFWSKNLRNLPF